MLQHHHPFSFQSFSCWCWGVFIAWSAKVRTLLCLRWCTLRQPWEGESSGPPATAFTGIMCDRYNVWKYMEMRCTSNSKFCTYHLHYHKYVFCICSVLSLILTKVHLKYKPSGIYMNLVDIDMNLIVRTMFVHIYTYIHPHYNIANWSLSNCCSDPSKGFEWWWPDLQEALKSWPASAETCDVWCRKLSGLPVNTYVNN